ncbi:MAG: J domain-containing protein [Candidatus Woesearchaeota archaeon]
MIKIKGYEFSEQKVKDSFNRRAVAFNNSIISNLKKVGVEEEQIDVSLESMAIARKPAFVSWYHDGQYHYYSYNSGKFVENLAVINKLIQLFVADVLNEVISLEDFFASFREKDDVEVKRKEAREYFGLEEDFSLDEVNKAYKKLAKNLHPDMPNGDVEGFKKLNEAHKILKREFS